MDKTFIEKTEELFFKSFCNPWAAFIHDLLWVPLSLFFAFWVRFNLDVIPDEFFNAGLLVLVVALPLQGYLFCHFGLYRCIWRFASLPDLERIVKTVIIGTMATFLIVFFMRRLDLVPRSILFLYPLFLAIGLAVPRLFYRWLKDQHLGIRDQFKRALVVGAGRAGDSLIRNLLNDHRYRPLAIVDDDPLKMGRELHGVRVMGPLKDLPGLIDNLSVDVVLLAIPSAGAKVIEQLISTCQELHVPCRTLPSMVELADGKIEVSKLREIRIEDLLGRTPVKLDKAQIRNYLHGKRVLITGAGGSIGSELCRQVMWFSPEEMILVDNGEYNLYEIEREVREHIGTGAFSAFLGDVRDKVRMNYVFEKTRPQVVFHAAAYKHVPIVEKNPVEGTKSNVLGTKNVADLSVQYEVEKFVLVSTDKAVNPANVMGASKRVAEIYCQNLDARVKTKFITTRFGNVLGSAGSVLPLFREQITRGGPVTVTHPDMTRYFMTIPEACQLILQAGALGDGGEIFVLDMGKPVNIAYLARQMIRLSGYEEGKDIEITFTGIRPGEKLNEELLHPSENLMETEHPKIMLASSRSMDWAEINRFIERLESACSIHDIERLRGILGEFVPEYLGAAAFEMEEVISPASSRMVH